MSGTFQVISPVDGSTYAERPWHSDAEIHRVLDRARQAQRSWRQCTLADRLSICQKALNYFQNHVQEIATELTWQMGRPIRYAPLEITKGFKERAEHMMSISEKALSDVPIENSERYLRFIRREPLGTVVVLAPWNYPYLTSVNVIFPALLAGNTVILKHAKQTPLCAERYAAAFAEAGLPTGVFQYVHASHEAIARLVSDEGVDYVAFTGSVAGGRAVLNALGPRFVGSGMELGGKDPAYVRVDADLEKCVADLVDGAFFNSGQSCCGIERIYVNDRVYNDFVERFVAETQNYRLGRPTERDTTLGPVVRNAAADFVRMQVDEAVKGGAESLIDAKMFPARDLGPAYLAPQVLIRVDHSMRVMHEETFGPVVGIMPVKSDEEALRLMNDSPYGLTASIWTADVDRALELSGQLQAGTCFLNRCDYLDPALAWSGVKNSGKGCTLSEFGYQALTQTKSFHFRKS